jgi:hypothetical protein
MSDGGRYTQLLQQLAGLQEELSKSKAIGHTLAAQNETLMQSHEQLRSENDRVVRELREAESAYVRLQGDKAESDRKAELALRDLRGQFEKQSVEFAGMQADMARRGPQDLQIIRMQLLEDLSSKFRDKVAAAEAEAEKYRELFFTHKRAHDLVVDEKRHLMEAHTRRLATVEKTYKSTVDKMSVTVQEARATLGPVRRE